MTIDFAKGDGLVPAIVQDAITKKVLMLGYMNEEAYRAIPSGPVCHTGTDTCFGEENQTSEISSSEFLFYLEDVIKDRRDNPVDGSYTNHLFSRGLNKISQKVGEEAVELVIESKDNDKDLFLGEAADLMYHLLVLLVQKECSLSEVVDVLKARHSR